MSDSSRDDALRAEALHADALRSNTASGQDDLTDEAFLQIAFSQMKAVEPSATLERLVAQIPISHPKESLSLLWPFQSLFRRALALGLATALGVVSGGFLTDEDSTPGTAAALSTGSREPETSAANEAEITEEMDLLFALATASDWDEDPWALSETVN